MPALKWKRQEPQWQVIPTLVMRASHFWKQHLANLNTKSDHPLKSLIMQPRLKDPIPDYFEVSGTKVKCTKCTLLIPHEAWQWIDSAGWKNYLKSGIHAHALRHEEDTPQQAIRINQATEAALAEDAVDSTDFVNLTATLSLSTHALSK
ncbi:hypothetical protein PILCRDRAFT_93142 [Piloderma croceum F 1598]|uniref:Uncharacterized protein n=1 Tax=Piloderma croceum (strain F 1598) TaxID=765440 RepID=A0A0C3EL11_PILCF|nr:hypothetical protein PILCRDRAFT_93142 [Piloderma croceum F 1598]